MRRPSLSAALGILVSVASLGAVVWWISRQDTPHLPSSSSGFAWLGVALCVVAGNQALRGWRWHRVMRHAGVPHRLRDAFGLTLVAYMGNNVLPARGGELLKIGLLGVRTSARRREVLGTVVADRLLDVATLAALFAALTWAGVKGTRGSAAVAAAAGRFERFAATIRPVARASRLFASPHVVPLGALSVAIWALDGLTLLLVARGAGVDLDFASALAVVVLASLFAAIPAAPGYAGTFDAGVLVGLHAADVTGSDAVGVLLLARFVMFVPVTVVGLGTLLLGYRGDRGLQPPSAGSPGDDEELLAEQPPGERQRKVASGQPGARG